MHAAGWLQALVAAALVMACAAYWLGRLFPASIKAGRPRQGCCVASMPRRP